MRAFLSLLALTTVLLFATSCGGGGNNNNSSSDSDSDKKVETPKAPPPPPSTPIKPPSTAPATPSGKTTQPTTPAKTTAPAASKTSTTPAPEGPKVDLSEQVSDRTLGEWLRILHNPDKSKKEDVQEALGAISLRPELFKGAVADVEALTKNADKEIATDAADALKLIKK